ncbi:MAG: hypothetical protein JJE47_05590 [Acidimicrobiia bacterium]|nr:hypothetical protein [Acidimicrobiia bacterium]
MVRAEPDWVFVGDSKRPGLLTLRDGHLVGLATSDVAVVPADETDVGFAQLAYKLITLGSHVIEQRLLISNT